MARSTMLVSALESAPFWPTLHVWPLVNNFYGESLKHELTHIASSPERESYVIMEKMTPPPQLGLIAKAGSD